MKCIAMIPARYEASRFPGKLLKDLGGMPVIVRTYKAVQVTKLFEAVYVVTDSEIIKEVIEAVGGEVLFSKTPHDCGSNRIAEAAQNITADIIVNVQGDEPFTDSEALEKLLQVFKNDCAMATDLASIMHPINDKIDIENPNNVKVIVDTDGHALYFSRLPLPFNRATENKVQYYKHQGIYAFRKQALLDFYALAPTPLEIAEKIECLRFLEYGKKIKMVVHDKPSIGIDTPEDLEEARKRV